MHDRSPLRLAAVLGLVLALAIWWATLDRSPVAAPRGPWLIVAMTILPLAGVAIGRVALDRRPTSARAARVTTFVHYAVAIPLGVAIIVALTGAREWPCDYDGWLVLDCAPWSTVVGVPLVLLAGAAGIATVAMLALRGLGAPFAIAPTTRLATDTLYGWVRNPMVVAALALLVSLGVWMRSWWLIVWALLMVTPAMALFVRIYEERELEIRFGESYLEYKRRTPRFVPRSARR